MMQKGQVIRTINGTWHEVEEVNELGTVAKLGPEVPAPEGDYDHAGHRSVVEFNEHEIMWLIMLIQNMDSKYVESVREGSVGYVVFEKLHEANRILGGMSS